MADVGHGTTPRDYVLQASVLLAAYKHNPCPVTMVEVQETIRNFTADDLAHVAQIAARLEAEGV